ncbi:MAG TPA: RNA polymerase sigma factor [Bacteroidales bacterium]|nr:RNA polymerase sigma factor [Bacteroidales bacterium]
MNDPDIIRSVLNGRLDDFRELVERYQQRIFRLIIGYVHNQEEAEDLTQEVFIKAWQSLDKFRGDSSFSTWLHRIAINICLNNTRKNRGNSLIGRLSSFFGNENQIQIPFFEENAEEILIKEEYKAWLKRALDNLPENQRTAIILSKYDDLPQKEIAAIMNLTEGAVEALIQRAKKNLREKLSPGIKKVKKERRNNTKFVSNE